MDILFPVLIKNEHWILLLLSRNIDNISSTLYIFDPYGETNANSKVIKTFKGLIKHLFDLFIQKGTPLQSLQHLNKMTISASSRQKGDNMLPSSVSQHMSGIVMLMCARTILFTERRPFAKDGGVFDANWNHQIHQTLTTQRDLLL